MILPELRERTRAHRRSCRRRGDRDPHGQRSALERLQLVSRRWPLPRRDQHRPAIHAYRLTDLVAHEGYPGHHTEHALKERLYTRSWARRARLATDQHPGVPDLGRDRHAGRRDALLPRRAGPLPAASGSTRPPASRATPSASRHRRRATQPALGAGNAALLLHEDGREPEEVVAYLQALRLSRERGGTAAAALHRRSALAGLHLHLPRRVRPGLALARRRVDRASVARRFRTLLTEQVYPSQIAAWAARDAAPFPRDAAWHARSDRELVQTVAQPRVGQTEERPWQRNGTPWHSWSGRLWAAPSAPSTG